LLSIWVLAYNQVNNPNAVFCRLIFGASKIITVERLFILATFSAVVLAIVIRGISFITPLRLFFSIAVGWVLAIVINIDVFIPQIFIVTYVDNIACFPNVGAVMHADVKIFIDAVYITFGGIIPLLVCLVIPIVALCYINHKAVSESGDYSKALAKFGLFLVAGNFINLLGQTLPTLIAYDTGPLNVYVAFGFAAISIIPTPILTIIFLKPVREHIHKQLKQCLSCFALHKNEEKIRMKQFTSSNTATDTSQTLNDIVSQEGVDQHSDFTE
jgi:ABC-type tungstate transport system substrate-binding protein